MPMKERIRLLTISARNPGPPSLDFNFAPGHIFAYIGYEMVAKCLTFTELGATVKFRIGDALNFTTIESDLNHYGIKFKVGEDDTFYHD